MQQGPGGAAAVARPIALPRPGFGIGVGSPCHPGVGWITALGWVLVVGPIERFARAADLASYVGLVPTEHSSAAVFPRGLPVQVSDCLGVENLIGPPRLPALSWECEP